MRTITGTALGALLFLTAACSDNSNEQQAAAPSFLMPQCSPVDPQCALAVPPRLGERPEPAGP